MTHLMVSRAWDEIPDGSYWAIPESPKVFGATKQPELCRIFTENGERLIHYEGNTEEFSEIWSDFVYVACERPTFADVDISASWAPEAEPHQPAESPKVADLRGQVASLRALVHAAMPVVKEACHEELAERMELALEAVPEPAPDMGSQVHLVGGFEEEGDHLDPFEIFQMRQLQCELGVRPGSMGYSILRSAWDTAKNLQYPRPTRTA
ncbi:hypothetical protein, partial [Pseudomonas putida]